jgi:tellurite resistance protein
MLDAIKKWLRRGKEEAEEVVEGGVAVARPEGGADSETSTNAQAEGASGEPWPGRDPEP